MSGTTRGAARGVTGGVARGVTCLGEALVVLVPDTALIPGTRPGDTADTLGTAHSPGPAAGTRTPELAPAYTATVGGAEANTACALAGLGVPTRWVGRVGDDRFGRLVLDTLRSRGVDVTAVETDPVRPTGLYVKEIGPAGTRMRYYRAGSAASAMTPALAAASAVREAAVLHLSGITPALSDDCFALINALLDAPRAGRVVSFDVNWRPALWQGRDPALLLGLARRADLVFVGADEAESAWGTGNPRQIRELIPEPPTLVVKQGADGAHAFFEDGRTAFVPPLPVEVVEATGAGDAFAAGYLAGLARGLRPGRRMVLGTLAASAVLQVRGDHADMPAPETIALALGLDPAEWLAAAAFAARDAGAPDLSAEAPA